MVQIQRAARADIEGILNLLAQVLAVHVDIRADLFIPNSIKYSAADLENILLDEQRPIFVAHNAENKVKGYVFCILRQGGDAVNMYAHPTLFIDDFCVDQDSRGEHIGQKLMDHVKVFAAAEGYKYITLRVWEGNDPAKAFYVRQGMRVRETTMEYCLETDM